MINGGITQGLKVIEVGKNLKKRKKYSPSWYSSEPNTSHYLTSKAVMVHNSYIPKS